MKLAIERGYRVRLAIAQMVLGVLIVGISLLVAVMPNFAIFLSWVYRCLGVA